MKRLSSTLLAAFVFSTIVYAQPGTWRQVGESGIWNNTVFVSSTDGVLYTIEKSGALYKTDPTTAAYTLISSQYGKTAGLVAGDKNIFTIETDGSLYRTNPSTGV